MNRPASRRGWPRRAQETTMVPTLRLQRYLAAIFPSFTIAGPTTIESPCRSRRPSLFSVGVGNLPAAVGDSQNFIDYGSMVTLPISRRKSVLKEFTHRGRPPHSVGMGNFEMARAVVSPAAAGAAQLVAEYLAVAWMDRWISWRGSHSASHSTGEDLCLDVNAWAHALHRRISKISRELRSCGASWLS
jgi:hypothetical protein